MIKVCYNCTKRFLGCHSTCKDYIEEVEHKEQRKAQERLSNTVKSYYDVKQAEKRERYNRKKNKKRF